VTGAPPHAAGAGEVGACCQNTTTCGNQCNITLKDTCTNANIACNCGGANYCDTTTNTCKPTNTCGQFGATGAVGAPCSNGNDPADFPRFPGDATGMTCKCSGTEGCFVAGGAVAAGAQKGTCCQPDVCPANSCAPIVDHCSGKTITCGCSNGFFCAAGNVCTANATCASLGATGASGTACSNNPSPTFPRGDGTNLSCPCNAGGVCTSGGAVVSGTNSGSCCVNTAVCAPNTCGTVTNTCTGQVIQCACNAGSHCSAGACTTDKTCATYSATGAVGAPCSTGPDTAFHDGPGGANLTCPCSTAGGLTNDVCVGSTGTTAGTCTCTPSQPTGCGDNGKPNGCGGTMTSTCGTGQVCVANACCTSPVCPTGNAGDACGTISACGQSVSCACTAQFQSCGAVTPNVCGCKAKTLADCGVTLPAGQTSANGCGGFVTCPG
jgi:hypothetical protein